MKYVVRYYYCNKQYHENKKYPFWIYPKLYCSVISEEEYHTLEHSEALVCLTKKDDKHKTVKKVAFIVNVTPVTRSEQSKYKDLKLVDAYEPNKDEKHAIEHFKKIKFGL